MRMVDKYDDKMPTTRAAIDIDWHPNLACGICRALQNLTLAFVPISVFLQHYLPGLPAENLRQARPLTVTAKDFAQPLLAPTELVRVNAFKSRKRQAEWMAGRLAAKSLAQIEVNGALAIADIVIAYHAQGAPYLVQRPDLTLSISHAADYAVAGLGHSTETALGLDIEKRQPLQLDAILPVAFSDRERRRMPPADQDRFFECWTLKEAYLKYLGRGFRENLKQVEILDGTTICHQGQSVPGLRVHILRPLPEYTLAVVSGPHPA